MLQVDQIGSCAVLKQGQWRAMWPWTRGLSGAGGAGVSESDMWFPYLLMNSEFLGKMDCAVRLLLTLCCWVHVHVMIDVLTLVHDYWCPASQPSIHPTNQPASQLQSHYCDHMWLMLIECENRLVRAGLEKFMLSYSAVVVKCKRKKSRIMF